MKSVMVAISLLCGASAVAQQNLGQAPTLQGKQAQIATLQTAVANAAAASPTTPLVTATDQVSVTAQGETRDVQTVD